MIINLPLISVAGSSNSQDSFPAPGGASNTSMDGYNNYPAGYPPNASGEYNAAPNMPRPPSQSNTPNPHPGEYFTICYACSTSVRHPWRHGAEWRSQSCRSLYRVGEEYSLYKRDLFTEYTCKSKLKIPFNEQWVKINKMHQTRSL